MIFRRRVLESDYAAAHAVDTLQQVHEGNLPFDRTMRISTAEENAKDKVALRVPTNLATVRLLLKRNADAWERLQSEDISDQDREETVNAIEHRRRKFATLLEECCLRTSRIQQENWKVSAR